VPHRLVLTGKRGWGCEGLTVQAARLQIAESIHFTEYVPDEDLPALYSAADVTAYPSLYEGFGLPPLESMACGAPTFVSDAPAMPEVAGDGALVLPVIDSVSWGEALIHILTHDAQRAYWSERGLRRAAMFSWARTAAETRAVYEQALEPALPSRE
jgi:glycosyltransferase involved in cell wall biosynthesis